MDPLIVTLYIWLYLVSAAQLGLAIALAVVVSCLWPPLDPDGP